MATIRPLELPPFLTIRLDQVFLKLPWPRKVRIQENKAIHPLNLNNLKTSLHDKLILNTLVKSKTKMLKYR